MAITKKYHNVKAVKTTKPKLKVTGFKIDNRGMSSSFIIITLACLIIGILLGGFGLHVLTKDDCFEMIQLAGKIDLTIGGEGNPSTYEELNVKCVAFGQDVSDSVKIKYLYREDITHDTCEVEQIDPSIDGFYYVVYTSTNLKYRTVQLIRNVTVLRSED